jgi:hypothetical protein
MKSFFVAMAAVVQVVWRCCWAICSCTPTKLGLPCTTPPCLTTSLSMVSSGPRCLWDCGAFGAPPPFYQWCIPLLGRCFTWALHWWPRGRCLHSDRSSCVWYCVRLCHLFARRQCLWERWRYVFLETLCRAVAGAVSLVCAPPRITAVGGGGGICILVLNGEDGIVSGTTLSIVDVTVFNNFGG